MKRNIRRPNCLALKQCLLATLCSYIVFLRASILVTHFWRKPLVAITCATKDWSCGSTLYEELARELRGLGLYTAFKRGSYLTSSSSSEFSMFFVGADYELPTAVTSKEYMKSTLRVLLHLEPYDLYVRGNENHHIDVVLTTTQLSPVSTPMGIKLKAARKLRTPLIISSRKPRCRRIRNTFRTKYILFWTAS